MSVKTIFLSKQSTVNGKKAYATGDVALNLKKYTLAIMGETGISNDDGTITLFIGDANILQMKIVGSQKQVSLQVPTYANNAAAIAGGLTADMMYKTVTGELRIVV